jgi:hypothetical protein
MKSAIRYLLAAAVTVLLGFAFVIAGRVQRDIAQAQHEVITGQYDRAAETFERSERYYEYLGRVPGIGQSPLNAARARRAALQYWRHDYATLVPDQEDPVAAVPPDNVDLQMVVANGVYRSRQEFAKDLTSTLDVLNSAINAYLTPLRNSARREDAAFNYEYLLRRRDELETKRAKPGLADAEAPSPHGRAAQPDTTKGGSGDFKILVPLAPVELLAEPQKGPAGKGVPSEGPPGQASPIKRKG